MLTSSEIVVTAAIWGLTAAGGFFGTRAALRKRKLKGEGTQHSVSKPAGGVTDQR